MKKLLILSAVSIAILTSCTKRQQIEQPSANDIMIVDSVKMYPMLNNDGTWKVQFEFFADNKNSVLLREVKLYTEHGSNYSNLCDSFPEPKYGKVQFNMYDNYGTLIPGTLPTWYQLHFILRDGREIIGQRFNLEF